MARRNEGNHEVNQDVFVLVLSLLRPFVASWLPHFAKIQAIYRFIAMVHGLDKSLKVR